MPNFLPSGVQMRTSHGECDNRFPLRGSSEREGKLYLRCPRVFVEKRSERARLRTWFLGNFLLPLAVSIPEVGVFLIVFLPPAFCCCGCVCGTC